MRALALLCAALVSAAATAQVIAVRADLVYTGVGAPIRDGIVVIEGGKVTAVGPRAEVLTPAGIEILTCKVATPGLIDAHSVVGLSGAYNQPHDQDQLDRSASMQPELRAVDAFNAKEKLVGYLRSFGITTIHTGHAPGALISGQTMVVKTTGRGVDQDVLVPCAMVACTLGEQAFASGGEDGAGPTSPKTRSKAVALLRAELIKAREYAHKRGLADDSKHPAQDLRLDTLAQVVRGELPLLVTANREHDISAAMRVAREFDLKLVLDGAAESYLLLEQIAQQKVPVLPHPPMARTSGALENATRELAKLLADHDIAFALQSGFESYVPKTRVVLWEAGIALQNGLTFQQALAAITVDAARLLGVDARVGSLDVGKDGDVALFDGDPFEYTTHCVGVVIEGRQVGRD